MEEYKKPTHFYPGLDPGLIDIVHVRNIDGNFMYVIKSTEFRDQAGGNYAKKKTDDWRDKAMLNVIDNSRSVNHSKVTTVKEYNKFLLHEHFESPKKLIHSETIQQYYGSRGNFRISRKEMTKQKYTVN